MAKDLLELVFADENRAALDALSERFQLDGEQTRAAVEELIPALARGMQKNTAEAPGMDDLLEALRRGEHARYVERPGTLGTPETTEDGNAILGHILGDKRTSREVANRASTRSGVSSAVLKKLLPLLATVVMGALGKRVLGGAGAGAGVPTRAEAGGLLGSLLDLDRDGSVWDDLLGMAARGLVR